MPRIARVVVPGLPHHVTQRGNNRQDVFFTDDDRRLYLELLREQSRRYDLVVRAYCLMTNHVHLVRLRRSTFNGRPLGTDRFIAKMEGRLNRRLRPPKMGRPRKPPRAAPARKKTPR